MTYRMAHLSFESQVLSSIKAILQAEQQLDEAKWNLSKAEKTLSDSLELGNMSEGSISSSDCEPDQSPEKQHRRT